ncbi:MAG: cystathionine beta-synthase [Chloroflexota bacterium]
MGTETTDDAMAGLDVHDNILTTIGDTPLVKLSRLARGVEANLLAKVEFFNPGGSVKDRIGPSIIEEAEQSGRLKPGGTIVEGTSGNTGVGLAIGAALKGYKCICVMPDKMSDEKIRLLRAYGAQVVITPTAVEPDDPRSYYSVSARIVEETPNAILANQYHNPVNPETHYLTTGPELWRQLNGKVDVFVAGMGTGGTISGVGRFLKEKNPDIQIVGVDPIGSILYDLHQGKEVPAYSYKTEGIGEDFLPSTTDLSIVDEIVQVSDKESFLMARRLVREEGIFAGGSCGSAIAGALRYIRDKQLGPDKTVFVVLPDSGSRYLSKIFNDDWMRENGFLESTWSELQASDVIGQKSLQHLYTAKFNDSQADVIALMKEHDISQLPVVDAAGKPVGIVTEVELLDHMLTTGHIHSADETIEELVRTDVASISSDTMLETLMSVFTTRRVAFVVDSGRLVGIITKIDLLDFLARQVK